MNWSELRKPVDVAAMEELKERFGDGPLLCLSALRRDQLARILDQRHKNAYKVPLSYSLSVRQSARALSAGWGDR